MERHYGIWTWVVIFAGELILPSIVVCVLSTLIVFTLIKHRKARKNIARITNKNDKKYVAETQLNILITTIAIVFVVVRLPYVIFYSLHMHRNMMWANIDSWAEFYLYASKIISHALSVMNYACNVFLFCVCGSTLRNEFARVYCCRRNKEEQKRTKGSRFSRNSGRHNYVGNVRKDAPYPSNLDVNSAPVTPDGHHRLASIRVSHDTCDSDKTENDFTKDGDSDISRELVNIQFSPDDSVRDAAKFALVGLCNSDIDSDNMICDQHGVYPDDDDITSNLW